MDRCDECCYTVSLYRARQGRLCCKFVAPEPVLGVSIGRIEEEGLDFGWLTSIGYFGEVLALP